MNKENNLQLHEKIRDLEAKIKSLESQADLLKTLQEKPSTMDEHDFYKYMLIKAHTILEVDLSSNTITSKQNNGDYIKPEDMANEYDDILQIIYDQVVHLEDRVEFKRIFSREKLLGDFSLSMKNIIHECRCLDINNRFVWNRCTMHLFCDETNKHVKGFVYVERIEEEKQQQLELVYRSQHDLLTGLLNKATVEEKIDDFFHTADGKKNKHAFIIVDMDYFKLINDNFGHAFGDAVLSEFSSRLATYFRKEDIIGRVGGDEFVVLIKNIENNNIAIKKAEELCNNLRELYCQKGDEYKISVSIGIAYFDAHGTTYRELYLHSDAALYHSKKNGRACASVYQQDMDTTETNIKEIDQTIFTEIKKFGDNISEYVFRILYESSDREAAINSVLELIGKHYNVSRVYIFEDHPSGLYTTNTFEWCNTGIEKEIHNLQQVSYDVLGNYHKQFNDEGIYYIPDIRLLDEEKRKILEPQNITSMAHFSIIKDDKFIGFIGFDHCGEVFSEFSNAQLSNYRIVANILGIFLIEMRAYEALEDANNMAFAIINGLDSHAYVCEPETYKLLFINNKARKTIPDAKISDLCYKTFWGLDKPCSNCPMANLHNKENPRVVKEVYNKRLGKWFRITASWIKWLNNSDACLVQSINVTEYKD